MAYTTTTSTQDPSLICNLHHSSQQRQIPNPLSEARDRTGILMDTSGIRCPRTMTGTPYVEILMPDVMVLGSKVFGRCLGPESGAFGNGITAFINEIPDSLTLPLYEDNMKTC